MTAYAFDLAENADAENVGKFQAALAKLKPSCSACGKTLTKTELAGRVRDERIPVDVMDPQTNRGYLATSCQCSDRAECLLRSIWRGRTGMDLAGYRALRKRQAAAKGTPTREHVRRTIATPAPVVSTPAPVDAPTTPEPVYAPLYGPIPALAPVDAPQTSPGHVSGITTVSVALPAPDARYSIYGTRAQAEADRRAGRTA